LQQSKWAMNYENGNNASGFTCKTPINTHIMWRNMDIILRKW